MSDSEQLDNRPATFSLALRLAVKRGLDIVLSLLLIVVLSPVLVVSALVILVSNGGPVLFRQTRVGRNGHEFVMIKFRTMTTDAEQKLAEIKAGNQRTGPLFKVNNDPRVTTVGRVLRRSSIDELPQLFNVLAGSMSLVGPRPALPAEVAEFSDELRQREAVPQGLTGLWQLDGRTDPDFARYAELDLHYVKNWTLRLDLWIIIRTPFVILRHVIFRDAVAQPAAASAGAESEPVHRAAKPATDQNPEPPMTNLVRGDSALELAE
jgi:lipopolysaccharide/colanic/teichoic acid biosynthesis glycosyltransferase